MIEIKSYIMHKNKFIPVENFKKKFKKDAIVEGAMELKINDVIIIDLTLWDMIDGLWGYLINGLIEIIINKSNTFSCYFPDQPTEIIYELFPENELLIKIVASKLYFTRVDLFQYAKAIIRYGKAFFTEMLRIHPTEKIFHSGYIAELEKLQTELEKLQS